MEAFAGIDVAFAKRKRLPVCICRYDGTRLCPLDLRHPDLPEPPRGQGNRAALDTGAVTAFAQETLTYLQTVERLLGAQIARIGIDASRSPCEESISRRLAERAMDARGISCIPTPRPSEFARIVQKARTHCDNGGTDARIPHANQLWMLVGFALFQMLGAQYECLEVYPQATVKALGCCGGHKFTRAGLDEQYAAAAQATGWKDTPLDLSRAVFGPRHDRLDAYLAAWVASLPETQREACGCPPDDVIWIPARDAFRDASAPIQAADQAVESS